MSSFDISHEKSKEIKEEKKIGRNPKENPSPKNKIKAKRGKSLKQLQWRKRSSIGVLKKIFERKKQ